MNANHRTINEAIRTELESTHIRFHSLLDSLSEKDFRTQSRNPGWTNGEILAHMTFGFIVLNALFPMTRLWGRLPKGSSRWFARLLNAFTGPFNWFNALGARLQGKVFNRQRIGSIFDRVYFSMLKKINSIQADEWEYGMYYPTKWDSNFDEFMTLEKLLQYPITHFNFHLSQISR